MKGLNYKEPAFRGIVLSVTVCLVAAIGFLSNPKERLTSDLTPTASEETQVSVSSISEPNQGEVIGMMEHEAASVDYGKVTELAKAEFAKVFNEFENVQIEETAAMARTDNPKKIVVQFKYSSSSGNGVYGFLYTLDDSANPELAEQGKDITIDNLLR